MDITSIPHGKRIGAFFHIALITLIEQRGQDFLDDQVFNNTFEEIKKRALEHRMYKRIVNKDIEAVITKINTRLLKLQQDIISLENQRKQFDAKKTDAYKRGLEEFKEEIEKIL